MGHLVRWTLVAVMVLMSILLTRVESASNRNIIRCISDLHLGSSWFTNSLHKRYLTSFFNDLTKPNTKVKELVLLGDILELWLVAFNKKPLNVSTILKSKNLYNTDVSAYLRQLGQIIKNGVTVSLVIGNHDMELQFAKRELRAAISPQLKIYDEVYMYKRKIRFEHGHRYDLFNAPDPRGYRPIGYYVSRGVQTTNYDTTGSSGRTIKICKKIPIDILADASIPLLRTSLIFGRVLEAMFDEVLGDYDDYEDDKIVGGHWDYSDNSDVKLKQVFSKYNDLVDEWYDKVKKDYPKEDPDDITFALVKGGCGDYSYWVKRLADPIIIFGHTHEALPPKSYKNDKGGRTTYVNSGAWVNSGSMTYIDLTEKSRGNFDITLHSYKQAGRSRFVSTLLYKKNVRI